MQDYNKKHKYLNQRYKINLIDQCSPTLKSHPDKCYGTHGKVSSTIQFVNDGSGEFDVFTGASMHAAFKIPKKKMRIGWIQEPRSIMEEPYKDIEKNPDRWFIDAGFDYILTFDEKLLSLDSRFRFYTGNGYTIKHARMYQKSKLVSMISSNKVMCQGHAYRLEWVERLKDTLDLYGNGFNYIDIKEKALCDYMFSIAIENEITDTWITEKVMDCFATATIPVYAGTKKIVNYFNEDGIIFLDDDFRVEDLSPELYISKLDAVKDNMNRVKDYEVPSNYIFNDFIKRYPY